MIRRQMSDVGCQILDFRCQWSVVSSELSLLSLYNLLLLPLTAHCPLLTAHRLLIRCILCLNCSVCKDARQLRYNMDQVQC